MGKVLFGIIAVVASLMLVESLTCRKCIGALGICIAGSDLTCSTNTSVCFTGKTTFPSVSSSFSFNMQGCREPTACNMTSNSTLSFVNIDYQTQINCCSSDKCNPAQVSGAPSTKMTLTAAIGVAVLASMWGSML